MRYFFLVLIFAFTAVQGYLLWLDFSGQRKNLQCKEELKQLVVSSMHVFKSENLAVSSESFWRFLGKKKEDPWGTPYELSAVDKSGDKLYFWQSAGPDRRWQTEDDLRAPLLDTKASNLLKDSALIESDTASRIKEAK